MRKSMLLFLILVVGSALIFATGSREAAGGSADIVMRDTPISEYPIKTDSPVTLTIWSPLNGSASKHIASFNDNLAMQKYQENTGVKIKYIHPAIGQEKEQFNLMMASGDLPDIIIGAPLYMGGVFQGMSDGIFFDLTDYLPAYAPHYYRVIEENDGFYREVSNDQGRIPAFFAYKVPGDPPFQRVILREDVLAELGVEIPTTLDEYEPMFQKMLAKGMTPYVLSRFGYEEQFMGIYDVWAENGNSFFNDNGTIKYGPIEPGFKQYLELMNSWYKKGYISKDFTSLDINQTRTLLDTRRAGMFTDAIVANFNRSQQMGYSVTAAPYPRIYPGQKLHYERNDATPRMPQNETVGAISATSKHKDVAIRFLNYAFTEPGIELLNWGVEGLNFEKINGENVYTPLMLENPKFGTEEASYIYKMHFFPKYNMPDTQVHANLLKSPEALASRFKWSPDYDMDSAHRLPNIQLTVDELNRRTKLMADISTYVDEMVLKFIIGATPLSEFDSFVNTCKRMGIEEAVSLTQQAYNRYISK
jgi:putative aldouronate transport system substrate-binding protein